jgi:hypothetical protein
MCTEPLDAAHHECEWKHGSSVSRNIDQTIRRSSARVVITVLRRSIVVERARFIAHGVPTSEEPVKVSLRLASLDLD